MTQKSTIVSLPILNCNEYNYHDCVIMLQTYEKWIFEIYLKAGLIKQYPYLLQNPNLPDPPVCNPGQPGAHVLSTSNDPMYSMKIPMYSILLGTSYQESGLLELRTFNWCTYSCRQISALLSL